MELEKAFDFKALGKEFKAMLPPELEAVSEKILGKFDEFMLKSIELEQNGLVKGIVQVGYSYLQPKLKAAVDKIDGVEG